MSLAPPAQKPVRVTVIVEEEGLAPWYYTYLNVTDLTYSTARDQHVRFGWKAQRHERGFTHIISREPVPAEPFKVDHPEQDDGDVIIRGEN